MKVERLHVGWNLWCWWVLASTIGLAVGWPAFGWSTAVLVGSAMSYGEVDDVETYLALVAWIVGIAMIVSSVGIIQWPVLRRYISRFGWWVLATIMGGVVGLAGGIFAVVVSPQIGPAVTDEWSELIKRGAIGGAVFGASIGTFQMFVLPRRVSQTVGGFWQTLWAGPRVMLWALPCSFSPQQYSLVPLITRALLLITRALLRLRLWPSTGL